VSSRRREKRKRPQRVSAKRRLQRYDPDSKPGKASDYFEHFEVVAKENPGLLIVVVCRESGRGQRKNLDNQEDFLRGQVEEHGAVLLDVFRRIGPGWDIEEWAEVIEYALEAGAALLWESTDRALRSKHFHQNNNPGAQPTVAEFENLKGISEGVQLLTFWHSDMPWKEVRGKQSKRGMPAKGNKGGRRKKRRWKDRRQALAPKAKKMRDEGLSYRQIAERLNPGSRLGPVCHGTIANWLRLYKFSEDRQQ